MDLLGYDPADLVLHVNFGLLEDECCRTAFVRGAFLAGGSVTDPEKRYHLELATSHTQASREVSALLTEMGFLPHSVRRSGSSVIYFKQSEHIEDLLTTIGAPVAAMDIMTAKVDKEIRNGANRAMNCDMANVNKTVDAALEQIAGDPAAGEQRAAGPNAGEAAPGGPAAAGKPRNVIAATSRALRPTGEQILHESPDAQANGGGQRCP